jgi:superoxide dismutase, Cu-Zn family
MKTLMLLAIFLLAGPALAAKSPAPRKARANLHDSSGKSVGVVNLFETPRGLQIRIQAQGLKPGSHGIHFHEKGTCEGPDFKSAGSHFAMPETKHGLLNTEGGPHLGDLPNLEVGADGHVRTTLSTNRVTLGEGTHSLFKEGGTAVVIHAAADDQKTDPSGSSGDRIACGVVSQVR